MQLRFLFSLVSRRAYLLPLALLPLLATLLFAALRSPPPQWTLDLGAPGDTRFLYGFFGAEQGSGAVFRWSGPDARLMLHGAEAGPQRLDLRLFGKAGPGGALPALRLERAGRVFAALALGEDWRVYQVLLPPGAAADELGQAAPLFLATDTYRPGASDGRDLGVPVDWLRLTPLDRAVAPWQPALARAVLLAWGLGLGWWLLDLGFRVGASRANRLAFVGRGLAVLISAALGLGLAWWAWRDPYTLGWALPNMPWALGFTTVVLLATHPSGAAWGDGSLPKKSFFIPQAMAGKGAERALIWAGLALLVAAQSLFHTQTAVGAGIVLALAGLAAVRSGDGGADLAGRKIPPQPSPYPRGFAGVVLGIIFLVALAMRYYRLDEIPFGLWRDEARHGLVALDILKHPGYRPVYIAENRVNMPALGLYPFALALRLWDIHPWTMRMVTALAGALTVFPLYGLVARLWGRREVALLAAALLAASSWHIAISRFSFPTVFEPLFGLTGLWLLAAGVEQRAENREQRTESREQRTESREQRTENREQRTENREQVGWHHCSWFSVRCSYPVSAWGWPCRPTTPGG